MDNLKCILIVSLFVMIWICKPIPWESVVVVRNQPEPEVLYCRGGARDLTEGQPGQSSSGFITPNAESSARCKNPRKVIKFTYQNNNPPKGKSIQYKPGAPSGGYGSANPDGDHIPDKSLPDKIISDTSFWDTIAESESEDDKQAKEVPTSTPTGKLTRQAMKESDFTSKQFDPVTYKDWEGESLVLKSFEVRKAVFTNGKRLGITSSEDAVSCPTQEDPTKYQRQECSRITDQAVLDFQRKIIEKSTSTKPGMVKFEAPMPSYDTELAIGYLDMTTGDCFLFHKSNRKFWSYRNYNLRDRQDVVSMYGGSSTFKLADANKRRKFDKPEL